MTDFPKKGTSLKKIQTQLQRLERSWESCEKFPFGSVITKPNPAALLAYKHLLESNYNNIGFVANPQKPSIHGTNLLRFEAKVITMMQNLYRGKNCTGYITSGGTEGNLMGLLLARNKFKNAKTVVIYSDLTHYSIDKVCNILGFKKRKIIKVDKKGQMKISHLEKFFKEDKKYDNYLVIATVGYTTTGTADNVSKIAKIIKKQKKNGKKSYLHIDAATAGFVLPFSNPNLKWDFCLKEVDSLTVDGHKAGMLPYPAGLFLARKKNYSQLKKIGYIGQIDATFLGARPGVAAAAFYATLIYYGFEGFKKSVKRCLKMKCLFLEKMKKETSTDIIDCKQMNAIAISFPKLGKSGLSKKTEEKYSLIKNHPPFQQKNQNPFYTIYFMPHLNQKNLNKFIKELTKECRSKRKCKQ